MYDYFRGKLTSSLQGLATLEVGGIGYLFHISQSTSRQFPPLGEETTLYAFLSIREDAHTLFGFATPQERDLFKKLTDISGIGPKSALAILSHFEISSFHTALAKGDAKAFSKVPGIGKKTAERLLIEMGDLAHLPKYTPPSSSRHGSIVEDAISALLNLGYSATAAHSAVDRALQNSGDSPTLSNLITSALKQNSN